MSAIDLSKLPARWCSIDPGDRYVGFAAWEGGTCTACYETTPDGVVETLENLCGNRIVETIVCEKWELYPWLQKSLAGNEFLTSQLIGVIKYLANRGGCTYVGQLARVGKSTYKTSWYTAMSAKEKRQMPWWGKLENGDHAKDAWAHGRYFIKSRTGLWY